MLIESSGILGGKSYLHKPSKNGTQIPTAEMSRENLNEDMDGTFNVEVRQKLSDLNIQLVNEDYINMYKKDFHEGE